MGERESKLDLIAEILMEQSGFFECTYEEAWDQHLYIHMKEQTNLKEVLEFIRKNRD